MASIIKSTISSVISGHGSNHIDEATISKYRLYITAGPSFDKSSQRVVKVNSGQAHYISDHISINVRIKDYTGLPTDSPTTDERYFSDVSRSDSTFSISFSLTVPDDDDDGDNIIRGSDLYFGISTGHNPIDKFHIPKTLVTSAFNIAKEFIDPCLSCDISISEPFVHGPVLAGATTILNTGNIVVNNDNDTVNKQSNDTFPESISLIECDSSNDNYRSKMGIPSDAPSRRKHFLSESNREKFRFEPGRRYIFDFANGYIDWNKYVIKLPGFDIPVLKYIIDGEEGKKKQKKIKKEEERFDDHAITRNRQDPISGHKVRFYLKNIKTDKVHFVIMCTLLSGDDLERVLTEEKTNISD